MRTIATVALTPQKYATPEQLVVQYDAHDDIAGGAVVWLQWQHMAKGEWVTNVMREVKAEDLERVWHALGDAIAVATEAAMEEAAPGIARLTEELFNAVADIDEPTGPLCGDPSKLAEDLAWDDASDGEPAAFWKGDGT